MQIGNAMQKRTINGWLPRLPLWAYVSAALIFLNISAQAASIKNVQTGEVTFTAATQNVTITSVDLTKSILIFSERNNLPSPQEASVRGQLTTATNLRLAKNTATGSVTVRWYVAEFDSGITVQRGTTALGATTVNQAITAVNLAESFVIVSKDKSGTGFSNDDFGRARLSSTTNLEFATNGGSGGNADWQVVSFPGASVQRNITSMASGTGTSTATITSVDLTRSILLFSYNASNGTAANIGQKMLRGRFSSATQLEFSRDNTGATVSIAWEAIQLPIGNTVQSAISSFSGTATQNDVAISAVNLARAIAFSANQSMYGNSWGRTTYSADDNPGLSSFTHQLLNTTTLRLQRATGIAGTTSSVSYFVVDFARASSAPILASIGPRNVNEGANLNFGVSATDADGTTPSLSAVNVPTNATFADNGNGTGTFNFNPDFTQSGVFNVTFIASDGVLADSEIVAITVNNVNRAPVLAAIGPRNVNENANLNFNSSANDPDGTTPTMSAVNLPTGATFLNNGNGTGTFNFTPDFTQSGVFNVTFIASDGTLADSEVVAITVNNVNRAPVLTAIGAKNVAEGGNLSFGASATDPDATTPTFAAVGTPVNATFTDNGNGTATFNFNPDFTQSGVINVTIIASDGSLADSEVVAITVTNVNRAPVLAAIGAQNVAEGANLNFGLSATDPDATTPTFAAVGTPANATLTDNGNGTATFDFNPDFTQSGIINVTFITTDGALADSEIVAITVSNTNQAPVLAAIGPRNVNENANLNFAVSATDADGTTPTVVAESVPTNATFTDNGNGTGTFTFNPDFTQSGVYTVRFITSDGSLADTELVAITVNDVSLPPVLAAIGPRNVNENANLNFGVSATDPDLTVPTLSAVNIPVNATFIDNGNGTGTFDFNPDFSQSGVFNVTFIASDGTLADSEVVAITVNNVNRAPVLAAIGPRNVNENSNLNFSASATDPDATTPVLTAINVPVNATFTDNGNGTGTFDFNPDFSQSGVFNVTFIASDGALADSEVVAITVNNVNRAPVLASIGARSVDENANLNFNTSSNDADGTTPTMFAVNLPVGASYIDNGNGTATFDFTPSFSQSGVFNVTFIASDGALADSELVAITVNNVNRAPVLTTIGPRSVTEGVNLNFGVSSSDADGATPVLTATGVPLNASFTDNGNGTGTFNFDPTFVQAGIYNVTFVASDGALADSEVVAITVDEAGNQRPILAAIGPRSVNENANLAFATSASDVDGTNPVMIVVGLPLNASYTDNGNGTASFSFTPDFTQSGVYNLTFIASDGALADSEIVAITVNDINRAPVLAAIGSKVVSENANLNFGVSASGPDLTTPTLTALGVPLNATFTDNGNGTGTFDFNPDFSQSGVFNVTFIASDGALADSEVVAITVNNVNRAPVLASIGARSVDENANLSFNTSSSDADGTTPTMSAVNLPIGASYIDNGNGTATFDFTPSFSQSGVINVTFIASDGALADSELVAITVNNVNRAPVLAAIGARNVMEGSNLNFGVSSSDPDGTTPTLTAENIPVNATFTDNGNGTGTFNFDPDFTQSGVYNIRFIASDGTLADSEIVAVTVTDFNRAPVLAAIGPRNVNENANLNFAVSASDLDLTTPTLTAIGTPLNATFTDNGNGTGTFDFNPSFSQAGVYNVTFVASDGVAADSEVVTITVNNVNRAPVLAAIGPQSVSEGANLNFNATATDPDATTPTLTALNVPLNATFTDNNNGTGTFTFNPDFSQAGAFNVTFIASDGALADSEVVTITVSNVNRAPVLAAIGPRTVDEGVNLSFTVSASDADGAIPVLSAENVPLNATFVDNGNGSGSFSFDPDFTQSGVYNVRFIASDGSLADSEVVVITVTEFNRAPVLAVIGPRSVDEGTNLNFGVSASDLDLTTPTLTAIGTPLNATFTDNGNGTGSFDFNPDFTQFGVYNVTFVASDGVAADSEVVTITVNNVNRAPVLASIGPRNINEGANLNFLTTSTDPDGNSPAMTAVGIPLNSTYTDNNNGTGTFSFDPDFSQSGVFNVTFIASDGSLADSETVAITVNNVNQAPVLATIGARNVSEGANLNFNISASDFDATTPTVTAENVPVNASFTDNGNGTGTFNFDPDFTQSGVYNVRFIASDGLLADSEIVAITVGEVNRAPVLAAIGPRNVNENANLNFAVSASDLDLTTPALTAVGTPLNATFTDNGNGTGTFDFNPSFSQAGVYNVTFIASDGVAADSEVVAITVNNVNRAPVLASIGPRNVNEGAVLNFTATATDPDATTPTLTALNVPLNATFTDNGNGTGTFNFDPSFSQSGVFNVTFIASDGVLADSEIVAITVNNVNRAPVLATIGPRSVTEGANLNFSVNGSDPDGNTPTLVAENTPLNATFTDNGNGTGTFNFNPTFVQAGVYNMRFIVSDGSLADSETVAITVNEAGNQRPVLATIGPRSVTEGQNLTFNISATDPDGTLPVFSGANIPLNASLINNGNGTATFTFDPSYVQSTNYLITFIATDGVLADSEVVTITVNDAGNQRPVLAPIGPKTTGEGVLLSFVLSATDADQTSPGFIAFGLPANSSLSDHGNGTATFSFTPNFNQAAIYSVIFVAFDGSLADSETVVITVTNTNRAPVLAAIGPRTVAEGGSLNFATSATDPDGPIPVLTALNVPVNASYTDNGNGTGSFAFNPNFAQAGIFNVTFIASDGNLADSEVVAITVTGTNLAPTLATIGPRSVTEGANLNFNTSASDPDGTLPILTALNVPLNASYVDNGNGTGTFNFNPTFVQAGVYNVTFIASDGLLADSEVVAITVNEAGNQAPVLASIGSRSVTEGQLLSFSATATDPDQTVPTLIAQNAPSGAVFTDNGDGTASFSFTPTFIQAGIYNVRIIASDGTRADSEVVAITVNEAGNQRPVLAAIGARGATEGVTLNFATSATDADATIPAMTAVNVPANATYTDNGNGTGAFSFTPGFLQAGIYNVTFIASDGVLADSEVVTITVLDAGNQAPVLAAIGPRNVSEGANLNFNITATDPDASTPSLLAQNLPLNASFVDNGNGSGTFDFNPTFVQSGVYNVRFIATDGVLADTEVVAITVNDAGNQRPVLAAIGARNVNEGSNLNFNISATDLDATIPTLAVAGVPVNATFTDNGDGTGTFDFDPDFTQAGVFNVTFIASDGALADSEIVAITVNNVNLPPVLAAIGPRNVNEGAALNFIATATDPDATTPTLAALNVPLNATFVDNGNGTGTFNFSPSFTQAGIFNVTFIASDGVLADSEVVAITVNNVNRAPVLATIGPRSVNEGANLNFVASASDPDLSTPTLTALNVPLNATFVDNGNGTGTFDFDPDFTQSGVYSVTFIATDGTLADSEVVAITVNNVNLAPVLATIGPRVVAEGANLNFSATATDPDATVPTLSALNIPANATFVDNGNGSGTFDFNPDFTQGGVFNVTFIASDGALADSEVVAITVSGVNLPPVLAAIGPRNVNEGANLNFSVSASDPDLSIPSLTALNLPVNATFNDNGNGTGTFDFNPNFAQAGVFNVTFIASDGALADSEIVAITVNNVNLAPVLATIGPRVVAEGANLNFNATATDPDATIPTLSALNVPTNATFVDNGNGSGTFNFSPDFTQGGVYNVTFIASDGALADSEVVAITVTGVNLPPVLAAIGPRNVNEGANLNFSVSASDPDLSTPALTAVNVPTNATFVDNGNGTGTFNFSPSFTQSGVFNVTFIASDGALADSEVVAITVNNVNLAPVLAAIGPRNVNEGANLNFGVSASDPDLSFPTLSAVNVPLNATFTDNGNGTGTFNFNPNFTQAGVFNVTFIASDGALADSEVVAITVNQVNLAPILATIGPRSVNEGANLNFSISATDADATTPSLLAQNLPANATFIDNGNGTGTFNFNPTYLQDGVYNVRFIASDGVLADTEVVAITVFDQGGSVPPARVADLMAQITANSIRLTWSPISTDSVGLPTLIDRYIIYRGTRAYFTPTPAESIGGVAAAIGEFTDNDLNGADVVGDPNINYFYAVRVVDQIGRVSNVSNRVGEYDYAMITSPSTDFNLAGLPFANTGLNTAQDVINSMGGTTNINTLNNFIPSSQSYQARFAAGFGTNFAVAPGGVFQVNVKTNFTWSIAGRVPDPGTTSYPIMTTPTTDYSLIMIPFELETTLLLAQDVINSIPGLLNTLNEFLPSSQSYRSRFAAGFGTNFSVKAGRVYQANAAANGTFPAP